MAPMTNDMREAFSRWWDGGASKDEIADEAARMMAFKAGWQSHAALSAPAVPEGWVLAPVEPTPEMTAAGARMSGPNGTYIAMLAARPQPPASPSVPVGEKRTWLIANGASADDGFERVLQRIAVWSDQEPDEGESWESFYGAAFDMLSSEVEGIRGDVSIAPTTEAVSAGAAEPKKTMTLTLTDAEMDALEALAVRKELSKPRVLLQALRLYQLNDAGMVSPTPVSAEAQVHPPASAEAAWNAYADGFNQWDSLGGDERDLAEAMFAAGVASAPAQGRDEPVGDLVGQAIRYKDGSREFHWRGDGDFTLTKSATVIPVFSGHPSNAYAKGWEDAQDQIASWIKGQRADIPAHGWEFESAIRALTKEGGK